MNKTLIALALVAAIVIAPAMTLAAAKKASWYTSGSIENTGTSGFGGLRYQKTVDDATGVVCYTAITQTKDVSISCLEL